MGLQFFESTLPRIADALESIAKSLTSQKPADPQIGPAVQKIWSDITVKAQEHGQDDDPDHEVGDLQDVLKHALAIMSDDQLKALRATLIEKELL
jgi:hypothetical protein